MGWISNKLLGIRRILREGDFLPERPAINFIGLACIDNAEENRIDVTCDVSEIVDGATSLATPGRLVKRAVDGSAAFGGASAFEAIVVTGVSGITTTALDCTGSALFEAGLQSDDAVKAPSHTLANDVTETRCLLWAPAVNGVDWTIDGNGLVSNVTLGTGFHAPLDLPHGVELTSISPSFGANGGHGAFPAGKPANMPYVALMAYDLASGAQIIADASDTSATDTAYEVEHLIPVTIGGGGHVVDRETKRYYLQFSAEGGAGSISGAYVSAVFATWKRLADSAIGQD